jgi:hypothetical protein
LGKASVELAVGALVDASHAGAWMARSEGEEGPGEPLLLVAGELEDECERSLRWRSIARGQVELRAASQLGSVGAEFLAGPERREHDAMILEVLASCGGHGERTASEAADCLAPDCVVEANRYPVLGCR